MNIKRLNIVSSKLKYKYTPIKLNPYELYIGVSDNFKILSINMLNLPHIIISGDFSSGKSTEIGLILTNLIFNNDSKHINIYLCNTFNTSDFYIFKNCNQVNVSVFNVYDNEKVLMEIMDIYNKRINILKKFCFKDIENYNKNFSSEPLPYIYIVINNLDDLIPLNNLDDNYKEKVKCCNIINFIISRGMRAGIFLIMETENLNMSSMYFNIINRLCSNISFSNIIKQKTIINRKSLYKLGTYSEKLKNLYIDDKVIKNYISKSFVYEPKEIIMTTQDESFNNGIPKKSISKVKKGNKNHDTYK